MLVSVKMFIVERSLTSHVDKYSTCPPGRIALELVEQTPVVVKIFYTSGESYKYCAASQFLTELLNLEHHLASVAGATDKDDGPIAPVHLYLGLSYLLEILVIYFYRRHLVLFL